MNGLISRKKWIIKILIRPIFGREPGGNILGILIIANMDMIKNYLSFSYITKKKELRTIAPFCIVKRKFKKIFHYTIVEFIAQQWGATYLDFISSNLLKNEFEYVFDWLKKNRKYDLIHLCYIPEFTSNFDLKSENATVLSGCPEVEGESYSDVRKKYYSKNLKHKLNRIHNKKLCAYNLGFYYHKKYFAFDTA